MKPLSFVQKEDLISSLLGYIYSDGCISKSKVMGKYDWCCIEFVNTNENIIKKVKSLIENISARKVKITEHPPKIHEMKSGRMIKSGKYYSISWVSKLFYQFITTCDGIAFGVTKKRVPRFVIENNENLKRFFAAFFDGDGSITFPKFKNHTKPAISFYLTTYEEAEVFANLIKKLFIDFNPKIYRSNNTNCYRVYIFGIENCKKMLFSILPYVIHESKVEKIKEVLSMEVKHKITNWNLHVYEEFLKLSTNDLSAKEISNNLNVPLKTVKDWFDGRKPRSFYYKILENQLKNGTSRG